MSLRRKLKPWCWCVPAVLLILIIIVFPIIYTGYISLTNMNLYHWQDYEVIGLGNYARALFKFDSGFLSALGTTLLWTVLNMVIQLALGFLIALGLNAPKLRAQPAVQDAAYGALGDAGVHLNPALARGDVQHRARSAQQVDYGAGL